MIDMFIKACQYLREKEKLMRKLQKQAGLWPVEWEEVYDEHPDCRSDEIMS